MTIFLAGASRGVGREIAKCLMAQKLTVKAMLRSDKTAPELQNLGIDQVAIADALKPEQIELAMADSAIESVISTIGGLPEGGDRADYPGNRNLIDAAVKAGVKKFILVTSIGSGDSAVSLPPQVLQTLGEVLKEKAKAEQHLINSGLVYTIIRPGGLKSEPATGNGVLTEDPRIAGTIHRADVAQLVCRCVGSDRPNYKILSALDRTQTYGNSDFAEFQLD
ncbi:MAG: SDR family oxidoreductase [Leptolyngbyaceae cyanobacterium CSU_1_3]|nr:SDR family oxidoreductase [Leptolyngbyaceae cyanobacterium CSU_1_3]